MQYSTVQYSTQYSTNSQVPHDIDINHTKEWVVSIFMVGAALVPWCASETHSVIVSSDDSSPASRLIPLHREEVEPDPGVSPFHLGLAAAGAGQGLRHAAGGQVSSVSTIH